MTGLASYVIVSLMIVDKAVKLRRTAVESTSNGSSKVWLAKAYWLGRWTRSTLAGIAGQRQRAWARHGHYHFTDSAYGDDASILMSSPPIN